MRHFLGAMRMNGYRISCGVVIAFAAVVATSVVRAEPPYALVKRAVYANVDEGPLVMDVIAPTGKANGLGIVDVASGAGYSRINEIGQERILETFCARGYTLFVVRPGPTAMYSVIDMAEHVRKAIAFIKEHADEYRIDRDELGMIGTPAGVHLVALVAATADDQSAVQAAGVYFPPTDFEDNDTQNLYVQRDGAGWEQLMQQAFPGSLVAANSVIPTPGGTRDPRIKMPQVSKQAPKFLIVHGDLDPLVSLGKKNLLFSAMRDAGVATDMIVRRPGRDPGPTIRAELKTMADWFDKQLAQD